jgi:hypothetical protein
MLGQCCFENAMLKSELFCQTVKYTTMLLISPAPWDSLQCLRRYFYSLTWLKEIQSQSCVAWPRCEQWKFDIARIFGGLS